jgi:glycosyltransferase involved in cell wall biosynthesis
MPDLPQILSLTVFFPCFNEEENVRRVYESADRVLKSLAVDYEILFIDDGSTDRTAEIVKAIAAADPRVRAVHHAANLGYGAALRSGFKAAAKRLVFFTDGDGQFDLNELPPLLPLLERYDIVAGYRLHRQEGLIRRFNGWGWTKLAAVLFGVKVKDVNCAFKIFRRAIFEGLDLKCTGALISAEILAKAARQGFSIRQAGVRHYPRLSGRPTGAKLSVIGRAFRELPRLYREIRTPS